MEKSEMVAFWIKSAEQDWDAVQALFRSGNNMHALFFAHLTIEKLLKAHWVKDNAENYPPRVHNLEHLYNQTNLVLDSEQIDELRIITAWNMEGRYQDYRDRFYQLSTTEYTGKKLQIVEEIKKCLLEKMP
jgi:HEPN domain-containing protein